MLWFCLLWSTVAGVSIDWAGNITHNEGYVTNGALNATVRGNHVTLVWYWDHNTNGDKCVRDDDTYNWTVVGSTVTIRGTDYYWFNGTLNKAGDRVRGHMYNTNGEVTGSWEIQKGGVRRPPGCHPVGPPPQNVGPITWWFDIDDAWPANLEAMRQHPDAFQQAQPYYAGKFTPEDSPVPLNDQIWLYWGHDAAVKAWLGPMKELGLSVLPYVLDVSSTDAMHRVWANQTAWIKDAVAVAVHYGFDGWFVDYEPEHAELRSPATDESKRYAEFIDAFAKAMHLKGLKLTMYVTTGWCPTSHNYAAFAATSVDALQSGAMYDAGDWGEVETILRDVRAARKGDSTGAGIGLGPYEVVWTPEKVNATLVGLAAKGVNDLCIFRLNQAKSLVSNTRHTVGNAPLPWPADFWWVPLEMWGRKNL